MTSASPPPVELHVLTVDERFLINPVRGIAVNVAAAQGLPERDIVRFLQTDPTKSLIRNPAERIIPKLFVENDTVRQAMEVPITNLDDQEPPQTYYRSTATSQKVPTFAQSGPFHRAIENEHESTDDYWKKQIFVNEEGDVNIEPIENDKNIYDGPFGLTRKGSFAFYIIVGLFTLLSGVLLIMTGVFYSQKFPNSNSSSTIGLLTGLGVCAFSFYLGLQLLLFGVWHQKHRQENPIRRIHIEPNVRSDSKDHLKASMEIDESFDYSFSSQQPMDHPPYGSDSNPQYGLPIPEQLFIQQPYTTMGTGVYDPIVRPISVRVEAEPDPDPRFFQPMELSLGLAQSTDREPPFVDIQMSKIHRPREKPVAVEPSAVEEFDDIIQLQSTVIEQPLPLLLNASDTSEIIQTLPQVDPKFDNSSSTSDFSSKKKNLTEAMDSKTDVSSSTVADKENDQDRDHRHHHHHHRRHHSHHHDHRDHHHHHSPHRHHHHHHHHSPRRHHHHNHHDQQHSPYAHYMPHVPHQFHNPFVTSLPRTITPFPRIITPHQPKIYTKTYRETAINTGTETKIMRDSSVTADLDDITNQPDNRLDRIPVVRRTIIVEPYPAQPSSQIVVKPRSDMIGKISLSRDPNTNEKEEQTVYPTSVVLRKQKSKKKKKKSSMINDNVIEDLDLEDVSDDDKGFDQSLFAKSSKSSARKTIKNAFYN